MITLRRRMQEREMHPFLRLLSRRRPCEGGCPPPPPLRSGTPAQTFIINDLQKVDPAYMPAQTRHMANIPEKFFTPFPKQKAEGASTMMHLRNRISLQGRIESDRVGL